MSNLAPLIDDEAHRESEISKVKKHFGEHYDKRLRRVILFLHQSLGDPEQWALEDDGTGHCLGDNSAFLIACDELVGGEGYSIGEHYFLGSPMVELFPTLFGELVLLLRDHPAIISVLTRKLIATQQPSLVPA